MYCIILFSKLSQYLNIFSGKKGGVQQLPSVLSLLQYLLRFIDRVFLNIYLRVSNFSCDVRHQLTKLTYLQTIKAPFLSVCLEVEVVVYEYGDKYGECKYIWSIFLCSILYEWPKDNFCLKFVLYTFSGEIITDYTRRPFAN